MAGDVLRGQAPEPSGLVFLLEFWLFKDCFGCTESLKILLKFYDGFFDLCKRGRWGFDRDCAPQVALGSVDVSTLLRLPSLSDVFHFQCATFLPRQVNTFLSLLFFVKLP